MQSHSSAIEVICDTSRPFLGTSADFELLLDQIGLKSIVLVGEASHGTHEFYATRAAITRRLINEKGFNAVAVEADWPDAYRVNRFVRGFADDANATESLAGFERFPQWMWRNTDVVDFVTWLHDHNQRRPFENQAGFYGIDLYSLYGSMQAVLKYLDRVDPEAATRARYRYACFEHAGEDPQAYGYAAGFELGRTCEDEVVQQLMELRSRQADYARRDGRVSADEYFVAEQNARLVKNAENYYRQMFGERESTWNLRDTHMADTIDALCAYLKDATGRAKIVVWAHNSHLGDARATEMSRAGELNVGQLMRQRHSHEVFSLGFTTHAGYVTAASNWEEAAQRKAVRPSLPDSFERVFHDTHMEQFYLPLLGGTPVADALADRRLERAIGVIYRPETERLSHYFDAQLSRQFDAVVHFDTTSAVEPLERRPLWHDTEVPEAYPSGL